MATTKKRLNITLSKEMEEAIRIMAKRDKVPQSAKAVEMLEKALELQEDLVLSEIAEKRLRSSKGKKFYTEDEVWQKINGR